MKKLLAVLCSLFIAIVICEFGLNLIYPNGFEKKDKVPGWDWLIFDPIQGWKNQANYTKFGFSINRHGLRGKELTVDKAEGKTKIFCLGDSRTFGTFLDLGKIRYDNDYPAILQQLLLNQPETKNVQVFNAGVIGYSSSHGLQQLKSQILDFSPDILIVSFGFNDYILSWNPALRTREPKNDITRIIFNNLRNFRTFQLLTWTYQNIDALHPKPFEVRWVDIEEYTYNLNRFLQVSRKNGIKLLFLAQGLRNIKQGDSLPAFGKSDNNFYELLGLKDLKELHRIHSNYQNVLHSVAEKNKIPIVDAEKDFLTDGENKLFSPYDAVHFNVNGAHKISNLLYNKLLELGWF